jgi:hypothetical protein
MLRFLMKDGGFSSPYPLQRGIKFLPLPPPAGDNTTPLPHTGLHTPPPAGDSQTIIKKKRLMKGNCFLRRFFTRFPQGWRFSVQNDNQGWRGNFFLRGFLLKGFDLYALIKLKGNFLLRRFLLPTVVEMTGWGGGHSIPSFPQSHHTPRQRGIFSPPAPAPEGDS